MKLQCRIILCTFIGLTSCRTTTPDTSSVASTGGDTDCQLMTSGFYWTVPQGGYTGADVMLIAKNLGTRASMYLDYCVRCDGEFPGPEAAWQRITPSPTGKRVGPNSAYSEYKAHFDLDRTQVGNPQMWVNIIGLKVVGGNTIYDNNFSGLKIRSIRIDGYKSVNANTLKDQYDNNCKSVLDGMR